MAFKLKELGVNLGYRCNFRCAHCSVLEDPRGKLTPGEVALLARTIKRYKFGSLLFVGGEPTLFIDIANDLLRKAGDLSKTSVRITTNGHFASTRENALKTLSSFFKLNKVQLSYDKYHAKFLPFENISNLYEACRVLGKEFNVIAAIESPMDIMLAEELKKAGKFKVAVQKVLPVGRAKINGIHHPMPSFDRGVLRKSCPNRDKIMYFCGRGFSSCCSSMVYNPGHLGVVHASIGEHRRSRFYRTAILSSFGCTAKRLGVSVSGLGPEHSVPCILCEHLFEIAEKKGGASMREEAGGQYYATGA